MDCLTAQFELLAEGGWGQLVGVLMLVGFYVASAIIKSIGERQSEKGKEKTRQIQNQTAKGKSASQIEEANRRRLERKLPYAKVAKNRENISEWDRRQEEIRRRAQERQNQLKETPVFERVKPVSTPAEQARMEPPPIPVAQAIDEDAEELKRQQRFAKAHRVQQARRRAQIQAQQAAGPKSNRTADIHEKPRAKTTADSGTSSDFIRSLLKDRNQLRSAILLKEILDKPTAMRDIY